MIKMLCSPGNIALGVASTAHVKKSMLTIKPAFVIWMIIGFVELNIWDLPQLVE
jgi:cyanate permease